MSEKEKDFGKGEVRKNEQRDKDREAQRRKAAEAAGHLATKHRKR
jgi:hypothetical protein